MDRALEGFLEIIDKNQVDVFDVPGAFELPLLARELASTGDYAALRRRLLWWMVASIGMISSLRAVVDGLMRAQMDAGVPVLSVVLTPHNFQETEAHMAFFADHFVEKGREAARAAISMAQLRAALRRPETLNLLTIVPNWNIGKPSEFHRKSMGLDFAGWSLTLLGDAFDQLAQAEGRTD